MARKTESYVALIAFLDRSDSSHPLFHRLLLDPPPLYRSASRFTLPVLWVKNPMIAPVTKPGSMISR
jgi:hypothetical protein